MLPRPYRPARSITGLLRRLGGSLYSPPFAATDFSCLQQGVRSTLLPLLASGRSFASRREFKEDAWQPNPGPSAIPRMSSVLQERAASRSNTTADPQQSPDNPNASLGVVSQALMALLPSLQADATIDTKGYRRVTARDLVAAKQPPVNTQMLVRDFIDDCLYNPQYGYFSKHATIYSPEQLTDFTALQDSLQFMNHVATKYQDLEGQAEHPTNRLARQVWHTPTELFNPHFGHAIAKYIVTEYKLNHYPEEDLIIYEMGAGNGTLMTNVMDYLQTHEPQVYERTRYNIIEISSQLAEVQANQQSVRSSASAVHRGVQFVNRSIFDWDTEVPHPCFFIAMEVIDNFAHDLIRYDPLSGRAYQGTVLTDRNGDFHEAFEAVADPLIIRYLRLRQQTGYQSPLFHRRAHFWRQLRSHFPFPPNLTEPEFVPTRLLQLMDVLQRYFPRHRLVVSDFFHLPEAVPGIDGPVVQTRYKQTMVPCSTYMVQPGWFDIFFPTNFELMRDMYSQVCRPYAPYSQTKVVGQRVFLERYADLEATTTQSGENPMLDYYENNKFLLT